MTEPIVIAVQPTCARFSDVDAAPGLSELTEWLRSQDSTEPVEIRRPEDVFLDSTGRVQRTFQFTTVGLSQLCSSLSSGLAQYVADVAGLRMREEDKNSPKLFSSMTAIKAINAAIRLRFRERLAGHGLIVDSRNRRVEGVVGPRYRFFSNLELVEACNEFVARLDPPAQFYEAALAGRRLLLRYRSPRRLFGLDTPHDRQEPFYRGWHFSNSEIGDCSVRTAFALVRQWSRTMSIRHTGRVVHIKGDNFGAKLGVLFQEFRRVADEESTIDFAERLTTLRGEFLGLGGGIKEHGKRLQAITTKLSRGRFSKQDTKKAISYALINGSYRTDRLAAGRQMSLLDPNLFDTFRRRTAFDLYNALAFCSRKSLPDQQEIAEELAYRLLTDQLKLPTI